MSGNKMRIQCPNPKCDYQTNIGEDKAGRKATCPKCQAKFHVPYPAEAPHLPDEQIERFEAILDKVVAGDWDAAIADFGSYPDEGPKTFLIDWMARYENKPPDDWDGGFSLVAK